MKAVEVLEAVEILKVEETKPQLQLLKGTTITVRLS
jgi:hypothetical protein